MKKIDIRKIYVCQTAKQSTVTFDKVSDPKMEKYYQYKTKPTWGYEGDVKYGLFRKVLQGLNVGYRHLLTGKVFLEASLKTGNQYVVIPESIELLMQKDVELCENLISKYDSFNIDTTVVSSIENKLNSDMELFDTQEMLFE